MRLQESGEMYLETIHILSQKNNEVRSLDVAEYMGFSKPSVSRAVRILKEGGYLLMDENGFLTLTDAGKEVAVKIYDRHTTLTAMLVNLGVDEETAAEDACKWSMISVTNPLRRLKASAQRTSSGRIKKLSAIQVAGSFLLYSGQMQRVYRIRWKLSA